MASNIRAMALVFVVVGGVMLLINTVVMQANVSHLFQETARIQAPHHVVFCFFVVAEWWGGSVGG